MAKIQHVIHTFGLSESEVAERIAELLMSKNPTVDTQPDHGGVSIIVTADSFNDDDAEILCKPIMDTAIDCLGTFVSSIDESIEENVVHSLANNHMQIALAESCTAGKLASRITEVPGASQVFECGIVSYSHEVKHSLLGVKKELLEEKGAVCAEVASAMANGARLLGNAAIGVAITGVAGPEPSDGQPVGTVYLALADSRRVWVRKIEEPHKSREEIREAAVFAALDLTRRYLEALPGMMAGSQPLEKHGPEKIITPSEVKKQTFGDKVLVTRAHGKAELIRRLTIWLLILVLLAISGLAIYYFYYRSIQNEQIYEDLEQAYNAPASVSSVDTSHYPKDMLSRFYALYDRNVDIGGWISIDDTKISYPVMTNAQGDYYASHDFDKSKSSYGVPYFSTSTKVLSKSNQNNTIPNYTILGNRTDDGQMLSSVCDYRDKGFFLQHQFLTMNTIYEAARWQVCGVMIIDSADNNKEFDYTKNTFKNKEERKQFLEELKNRSIFNLTTNLSVNDSLLFISVDYQEKDDFETERVVVIAKKLENSADEKAIKELSNNPNVIYPFALSGTIPTYTTTTTKTHKQVTTTTTKKTTQNYVVKRTTKRPTQKPTTKPVIVTSPTTIQTTSPPEEVTTTETQEDTTTTAQEPEENFNS